MKKHKWMDNFSFSKVSEPAPWYNKKSGSFETKIYIERERKNDRAMAKLRVGLKRLRVHSQGEPYICD